MIKLNQQRLNSASVKNRFLSAFAYITIAIAIGILVWSVYRIVSGYLIGSVDGSISFPLSLAIALILFGSLIIASNFNFAWLVLIGCAGQASALQLIDVGKNMHYQHYVLSRIFAREHLIPFMLIVIQTIFVCIGIWKRRNHINSWLKSNFKLWQLVVVLVMFGIFSATVSPYVNKFIGELFFAAFIQGVNLANIVLIAIAVPKEILLQLEEKMNGLFGRRTSTDRIVLPKIDRFAILMAAWVVLLSAFFSAFAYQRHPHIPDEVAYIYHARYLADGKLYMPAPPVPEAFEIYLMQFDGERWYPSPPIGWPMVLAIGEKLGLGWLVNPLLGGINILLIYIILAHLYSSRLARLSIFLLGISPWYVFMGMNFMTHMFTLTCGLLAALGLIWARGTGKARWILMAGLALGVMSLIRPLEALIWSGLVGLWALGFGGMRVKLSWIAALVITTGLTASLVLPYNKLLTGNASIFPINQYTDQRFGQNSNAYGFGPDRGMGWPIDPNLGHDPIDALINADLNSFSINIELFGWGTGSLLLAIILLVSGSYRKSDYLMFAVILAVFSAFFFYYFSGGPDFGARYWFLMIVPLVALSVRGLQILEDKIEINHPGNSARALVAILILGVIALVNYFPWRAIDKYYHYLNMRPDIRELAKAYNFGKSLVLIEGDEHPDFASAFVYNPINIQANAPIYAWDRNPEVRKEILQAYSDRPVWVITGPSLTQAGYQVIEGPVSSSNLLDD